MLKNLETPLQKTETPDSLESRKVEKSEMRAESSVTYAWGKPSKNERCSFASGDHASNSSARRPAICNAAVSVSFGFESVRETSAKRETYSALRSERLPSCLVRSGCRLRMISTTALRVFGGSLPPPERIRYRGALREGQRFRSSEKRIGRASGSIDFMLNTTSPVLRRCPFDHRRYE